MLGESDGSIVRNNLFVDNVADYGAAIFLSGVTGEVLVHNNRVIGSVALGTIYGSVFIYQTDHTDLRNILVDSPDGGGCRGCAALRYAARMASARTCSSSSGRRAFRGTRSTWRPRISLRRFWTRTSLK